MGLAVCAQSTPNFIKPKIAGQYIATAFNWSARAQVNVSAGQSGGITFDVGYLTEIDGTAYEPWQMNVPVTVWDGTRTETVTATGSSCALNNSQPCTLTASFALAHSGRLLVSSASYGVEEAIQNAHAEAGGTVVVGPDWPGTTAQITGASGYSNVAIIDQRSGTSCWYKWNGINYNKTFCSDLTDFVTGGPVTDWRSCGAKFDVQKVADGAMTALSAVLTSASGLFVSTDVGKTVNVYGASLGQQALVTTIASYQSATQVTLTASATQTVSGATVYWMTDDYAAITSCFPTGTGPAASIVGGGKRYLVPRTQPNGVPSVYSSQTILPRGYGAVVEGTGSSQGSLSGGSGILFPPGVSGIELDNDKCQQCTLRDFYLLGGNRTFAMAASQNVVLPAGSSLPERARQIASIQRAANVLTITTNAGGSNTIDAALIGRGGQDGLIQSVGSVVKISGVTSDATMNGLCVISTITTPSPGAPPLTFTCAQNGSNSGPFTNQGDIFLPTTGPDLADGIRNCAVGTKISGVAVFGFARHGFNAQAVQCPGGGVGLADDADVRDSWFEDNQVDGIMESQGDGGGGAGADTNVNWFTQVLGYSNGGFGFDDNSALGDIWAASQATGNHPAGATTPATTAISTISRTSGLVTVTTTAAPSIPFKIGHCVVVAGVTDSSFNTTVGSGFFLSAVSSTTSEQYTQPGAPADASSSDGTIRVCSFNELWTGSGLDGGGYMVGANSPSAPNLLLGPYTEGGQSNKWSSQTLVIGGVSPLAGLKQWLIPGYLCTNCQFPSTVTSNLATLANQIDAAQTLALVPGLTTDQAFFIDWYDHTRTNIVWQFQIDGTGVGGNTLCISRGNFANHRFCAFGPASGTQVTRINSESTYSVDFNSETGTGTGGVKVFSGGATPAVVASFDSTGKPTFNAATALFNNGLNPYTLNFANPGAARQINVNDPGATDAFAYLAATQTLTTKTIDISANTLKTATNTVGHYPRNNGTQYVDGTIAQADLPATSTQTIASGTATLGTIAIASAACATTVTVSASGVLTSDAIQWSFSADPTATTGYAPTATGSLKIWQWLTANNVNFRVCNDTGGSITPGAATLNWRVVR